jgi:hypothetical protein
VSTSTPPGDRGPWPEPDADDRAADAERSTRASAVVASDIDATRERAPDHIDDLDDRVSAWDDRTEAAGSRGISLAVAGLSVMYLMAVPALLVVGIYTYITVYAIVKAFRSGPDAADAGVVLIGVVGLVTLVVVLLGVGLWAIGRAADPRKRRT